MNKIAKQLIALVIALVVIFLVLNYKFGLVNFNDSENELQAAPSRAASMEIPVSTVIVSPEVLDNKIKVTGTLIANEAVELSPEMSGKITGIYFKEGDFLRKGSLLANINAEDLKAQLEKARFNLKLYQDNEDRQRQLLEKEAISQEEYDIAITELRTSEAEIKILEAQIAKAQIRAPFNGTVGLREVSEGSYVTPSTTIANFYNIDPIKIEFSVPGKYSDRVKAGQKISFTLEAQAREFEGEIYAVEPRIDPNTRTLKVRARAKNEERKLFPGQFANIEFTLETVEDALLVPTVAVIPELNGHRLFRYENGKAVSIPVAIGTRTDTDVQIINGIEPQDTVITSGTLQLRSGSSVSISEIN